jgi:hypothetical protein
MLELATAQRGNTTTVGQTGARLLLIKMLQLLLL